MTKALSWDIFCAVIDNYGDAGVCWRLARQLAAEHGLRVRLWIDRPESLERMCPQLSPGLPVQVVQRVEVHRWGAPFPAVDPADVVIEAFACNLPDDYVAAMAVRDPRPIWINLEYLSAEDWVLGCHRLASPHPRLPLVKHFFFPGFREGTGGLLRERELLARRDAFQCDRSAIAAFRQSLGVPPAVAEEFAVSLFCYRTAPVADLLAAWAQGTRPVRCLVPEGEALALAAGFFGVADVGAGTVLQRGALTVQGLPFLDQDAYDRLLWACDCNFVRGEDSFVRAQWAGRPFVWQIYAQDEDAHWAKLSAFLDLYGAGMEMPAAAAVRGLWQAWNRGEGAAEAWGAFEASLPSLGGHGQEWVERLVRLDGLAANLVCFSAN